jgi:hypothetical protein
MTKFRLTSLVLLAAVAAAAGAQKPAVLLSNAENLDLYYTIDPPGLTGPDTSSAVFVGKVVSFFSDAAPEVVWSRLEPLGVERVDGLAEGTHVLVGYFVVKSATEVPVRVIRLQAGGGIEERLYTIYREPATVMAKVGRGRLAGVSTTPAPVPAAVSNAGAAEATTLAVSSAAAAGGGAPADLLGPFWKRVEPIATFSGAFEPEIVTRQSAQGTQVVPFASASYWGVDGVRLREVRIARRSQDVVFRVQTFGTMSENESLLLYFQESRSESKDNRVTMEVVPGGSGKGGYVVLWRKSSPKPVIVGRFAQDGNVITGRIRYADASAYLDLRAASPSLTVDICTGHHEVARRVYEEYYHATIRLDQIPVVADESTLFL